MFFTNYTSFTPENFFSLYKSTKKLYSGYRDVSFWRTTLPLRIYARRLMSRVKSKGGRNCSGRLVIYTKSALKQRLNRPKLNYSYRRLEVGFVGAIFIQPLRKSFVSVFYNSNGSYSYLPVTTNSRLFILTRMASMLKVIAYRTYLNSHLSILFSKKLINPYFFILRGLPKNKFVSLIELFPNKGVQYVRSPGSKSKIVKMDNRTNNAIIKLPSGVKKVFSIYSIGCLGEVFSSSNKLFRNNKAGYYNIKGSKPKVRGVARNPVDHPHGGRTKAIRYPRTP